MSYMETGDETLFDALHHGELPCSFCPDRSV
jgi:hypothetical protein